MQENRITVEDAIRTFDALVPNKLSDDVKIGWLNEVEGRVQCEILGVAAEDFAPVESGGDGLSEPRAYARAYTLYLAAMAEMTFGNKEKSDAFASEFESAINGYAKYYIRNRK